VTGEGNHPKREVQAVTGGLGKGTPVSTARPVALVAVRPGRGGTRGESDAWTQPQPPAPGPSLGAKVEVVSRLDWGFARAKLGTTREGFCSQGDPRHHRPSQA